MEQVNPSGKIAVATGAGHGIGHAIARSLANYRTTVIAAARKEIQVGLIHPGDVDTDLVHSARPELDPANLLQPVDIAHTFMYLLNLSERCAVDEIYIHRRGSKPF